MILSTLLFLAQDRAPPRSAGDGAQPAAAHAEFPADDGAVFDEIPPENVTRGTFLSPHVTITIPIHLLAGDLTIVQVLGSGATDVDADLLDETGQVVARERGPEDRAWFPVLVREDRTYTLRVRNLGDWTNDLLVTLR